jgi:hypothetical protein
VSRPTPAPATLVTEEAIMPVPEPELPPVLARPPRAIPAYVLVVLAVTLLVAAGGTVLVVRSQSLLGFLAIPVAYPFAAMAWMWARATRGPSPALTRLAVAAGLVYVVLLAVATFALAFSADA